MPDPTVTLSELEAKILTYFYHPERADLLGEINRPEVMGERKAAILRLEGLGFLRQVEPFAYRITHEGHTFLDSKGAADA